MAKFKVVVSQWVQEMAEKVIEAEDEQDARDKALAFDEQTSGWNWSDGDSVRDYEVIEVEELTPEEAAEAAKGDDIWDEDGFRKPFASWDGDES
jgi:hypothetical protein